LFHWGKGNFVATAAGAVGLGNDGKDLEVWLRKKVLQGGNSELGSATEEDAQGFGPIGDLGRDPFRLVKTLG
jgi:hypothetical protein